MAHSIPKRHPELVSGSHREPSQIHLRGQMLKRVLHDITRSQNQQTKNKPLTTSPPKMSPHRGGDAPKGAEGVFYNYEKQRNLETNHPNRNQYPFGHRHYAWIEFMPLSL